LLRVYAYKNSFKPPILPVSLSGVRLEWEGKSVIVIILYIRSAVASNLALSMGAATHEPGYRRSGQFTAFDKSELQLGQPVGDGHAVKTGRTFSAVLILVWLKFELRFGHPRCLGADRGEHLHPFSHLCIHRLFWR
jgi:hypothetical protein